MRVDRETRLHEDACIFGILMASSTIGMKRMIPAEKVYWESDGMRVTAQQLTVGSDAYNLAIVTDVRIAAPPASSRQTIPFTLAVLFVVWAIAEVVNAPADWAMAAVASALAIVCASVVRMLGSMRSQTVVLGSPRGDLAVFESRDDSLVQSLTAALRVALADRRATAQSAWGARDLGKV
ncbi:DUF6232 family protein [Xylophilus sp. GOD-11R]|uniref:DUF6232 family protein n=1 Tax=Xylophilus sp. GOD-11R TaxID=3089814 RepID=UPI00298CA1A8|nr:DUF6232 family protein [Xylophilus sp. GOD-11R]WPB54973.1 DUF6232 family protein [Xylophilus sp. GOD-11R]